MKNNSQKTLIPILLTVFIDLLGFGILVPIIPLLLGKVDSPYYLLGDHTSVRQGYVLLGFLLATFPVSQFFAGPVLGQLSDKYGRKKVLALSLIGTGLSYVVFAIGIVWRSIPLLFLARVLDGFTGGNFSVAQAAVADITTPENRSKNFGLMGAALGIGFILGPYFGGKLSDPVIVPWFDATTPFWFAAILCLVNVCVLWIFFTETNVVRIGAKPLNLYTSLVNITKAYNSKRLRIVYMTVFLFMSGFNFFVTFASVYLVNRFGFTQGGIGDMFAYIGVWVVISQAILTPRLMGRFAEHTILRFSIVLAGFSIAALLLPGSWILALIATPIFAITNGITQSALTGLISRSVESSVQGEVLGINTSVQALAAAIPPIISGYVAASSSAEGSILTAAIVTFLSGILFILYYKPAYIQPPTDGPIVTEMLPM